MNRRERFAREQGLAAGLAMAVHILDDLAEVMLERELSARPGSKANYARRTRIKAYQVASKRVQTKLNRQRQLVARLETPEDEQQNEDRLKADLADLAL